MVLRRIALRLSLLACCLVALAAGCGRRKRPASAGSAKSTPEQPAARPASWLQIGPRDAHVGTGEAMTLSLRGFDNQDFEVRVQPRWSATRGSIDEKGRLTAPAKKGISVVTAEDRISGLKAFTVVYVGQEPPPAVAVPKPKPQPAQKPLPAPHQEGKPPATVPDKPPAVANRLMVLLAWKVGGKGFRRRVACSVACYAPASRWVKLFAVSSKGKMSLLQSRFAKVGTTSNFSADFRRDRVRWLEVRLYDRGNRLIARERRAAM